MPRTHHIAQCNIAKLRAPLDDPALADFVDNLERINTLGDGWPGFVWRLQTDDGDATAIRAFDDPDIIVNLTVWGSIAALRDFAYRSDHIEFLRRRREWFVPIEGHSVVLWWIPAGTVPTVEDARARFDLLVAEGPTADAFTFTSTFPAPVPAIEG